MEEAWRVWTGGKRGLLTKGRLRPGVRRLRGLGIRAVDVGILEARAEGVGRKRAEGRRRRSCVVAFMLLVSY